MHKIKREPQDHGSNIYPSSRITGVNSDASAAPPTAITADAPGSALTTILSSVEIAITQPATTLTTTQLATIRITDAAQFSSLQASESSATARTTSAQSIAAATTSPSSKAAKSAPNDLGTLVPAIVVPIAAVLIISFALFWFVMRRQHKKQLREEPDFVMASKPEKPMSRGNSNSSGHSSTRELVPMSKLEKEVVVTTMSDPKRSSVDLFPPKYSTSDIGVARPMTPPNNQGDRSEKKPYTNFSSIRPNTAGKGAPGSEGNVAGNRSRSQSASTVRGGQPVHVGGRYSPPKASRGPSPAMRGQLGPPPPRPARPPGAASPDPRSGAGSPPIIGPAPAAFPTNMGNGNRAAPPKPLSPTIPTGAFNGASPISQYSPIVKGVQSMGAVVAANAAERRGQPPPLKTTNIPRAAGAESPADENVLSHENMRIARLANSSRLGFNHSPVETNHPANASNGQRALSPLSENDRRSEGPAISPRLPPPLTREEMPHRPFARGPDSPAAGSSTYPSPSMGAGTIPQKPQIGGGYSTTSLPRSNHNTSGVASATGGRQRVSVVSRLSSDDGYVDMELDGKSDVSSLDEREKWETDEDRQEVSSRIGAGYPGSGYGSPPMSPIEGPRVAVSSARTGASKPNLRDRDSEGPFVLSRY